MPRSRPIRSLVTALIGAAAVAATVPTLAGAQVGGPVILGGDDLTSHGNIDTVTGASEVGWLYMEKAVANIKPSVRRGNDNTIAAFGSMDPGTPGPTSGDAGAGIRNAAVKNGMGVNFFGDAAGIAAGMAAIANGSYRPAIIWIAGDDAGNDLGDGPDGGCTDSDPATTLEGEALVNNAGVINTFVNGGGGLYSHGTCYPWLSALVPGLETVNSGSSDDLYLTPEGIAAFPGLTNTDVNAGPWHNHFQGNLGGLQKLVNSTDVDDSAAQDAAVVLGGGRVSLTERPTDLLVAKSATPDPATAGSNLTYTVTAANNGPQLATGVVVTDTLPAGLTAISSMPSQGTCSGTTVVSCALGDIAAGTAATVTIVVRPAAAGSITNTVTVAGNQPDPNEANNTATLTTLVNAAPPPPPARPRDRIAPRIAVAGVQARGGSCRRTSFVARFTITEPRLRRVDVFVNTRRVRRTTMKRFAVRVSLRGLRAGRRHTIRVVAVDTLGNRAVRTSSFIRCAAQAPARFTG